MTSPFAFVFDGSLDRLLPGGLTAALVHWLGLALLVTAAGLAVAVDVHRQGARRLEPAGDHRVRGRDGGAVRWSGARTRFVAVVAASVTLTIDSVTRPGAGGLFDRTAVSDVQFSNV